MLRHLHTHAGGTGFPTQQAWERASAWAAAAKREAMNAASKWRPAWAVLAGYVPVSARLHLALFYFYGVYYHWAKRATGDPHISTTCQTLYTSNTPTATSGGRQVHFDGRV